MKHVFSPSGGMNQDDSMITPTKDMAGKNAFQFGDYKYAANMRIGSSRKDNFNGAEVIKDTLEKTSYFQRAIMNSNSDFASGLTGWSQLSVTGGTAWALLVGAVTITCGIGSTVSNILYQAVSPTGKRMGFRVKISISGLVTNSYGRIIFLNNSTVLSSQVVFVDTSESVIIDHNYQKYINVELPSGCNRVGFQLYGTSALGSAVIQIQNFQFFDWTSGSRPAGVEKVIGQREDKETNRIYYAVYNASGNHSFRYYDASNGNIYTLLEWSGLNFSSTYFESMALCENYLGVTDRNNRPRLMDVNTISDLFLIIGSSAFREYHIAFHKWAPVMPPIVKGYYDGSTNNYTKFKGKNYQWSYRYIFTGKLRSRWSPISNAVDYFDSASGNQVTSIELYIPGFTLDVPGASTQYNYFNNDNAKFTDVVEGIEIAYREGVLGVWKLFQRYDMKVSLNTTFRFTGDSDSTPVATDDFIQLFDTVPFKAGTIESIDNRFVFADILEEEEPAQPVQVTDVDVVKYNASQTTNFWWNSGSNNSVNNAALFSGCSGADAQELGLRNYISRLTFKGRGMYKLGVQWIAASGWRSAAYTASNWMYTIPEETTIIDQMYALTFKFPSTFRPPSWAVAYQIVRTNCLNIDYFMFGACNAIKGLIDDTTAFNDDLQIPEVVRDRIRQHFENARLVTGRDNGDYLDQLANKPFYKSLSSDVRKTIVAASISNASRLYIDLNNWYNSSAANAGATQNNPLNNLYYNYREGKEVKLGDRVRFLASTNATPADNQKQVYDMPILEFTGRGIVVEKPSGVLWVPGDNAQTDPIDHMIEVYSPKIPEDRDYLYFECGEWYPVLYPGTEDRDLSKRDWTFGVTTQITCNTYGDFRVYNKKPVGYGDCHALDKDYYYNYKSDGTKSIGTLSSSMVQDKDRVFDVWEKNDGRIYIAYKELPIVKFKTTQARFGGQIVEESFVNNVNRFRDPDQKIFPSEYGRIRYLANTSNAQVESVGAILLAIGEKETFSIYVNRTTLEDLSGRTLVSLSDKILGSYNTLLGSHGTLNPESVSVYRGRVYYWDATYGSWIQYGRDGLTELGDYKMQNWFKDLASLLIGQYTSSTPPIAFSEFDPFNNELITFNDHSSLPATFKEYSIYKGAMFSDLDNRWKSCHSYEPDCFSRINTQLVSFKNGSVFLHEQGTGYLNFYGSKKDAYIEPVATNMSNIDVWNNISITSTDKWSVERFLSEYRGADAKRQSSLSLDMFTKQEDRYDSAIKQDANSGSIITGDYMRSRALRALMKLDPAVVTESYLHYVIISSKDSPKNP